MLMGKGKVLRKCDFDLNKLQKAFCELSEADLARCDFKYYRQPCGLLSRRHSIAMTIAFFHPNTVLGQFYKCSVILSLLFEV